MKLTSGAALLLCYLMLVATHFYYPKWSLPATEATLSWDVSGYYMYLPAAFIYGDLDKVSFLPEIIERYRPADSPYQAYTHANGNRVMKYSLGQAVLFSPAFAVAHAYASTSTEYPADGFSKPYQVGISVWSLLVAFLGLLVLKWTLDEYFSTGVTAVTLLLITFATNYLNYAAIDGAMTHNFLFTLYALLLYLTDRLYRRAGSDTPYGRFFWIGLVVGLMALTRPTEILALAIPFLWRMEPTLDGITRRLRFFQRHLGGILLAAVVCVLVGSLQLLYWKYVSGDWIEYSYQDQGFDWLHPHLADGLFSYKAGWLTYTPVMWFAILGFGALYVKRRDLLPATLLHFVFFTYVAFAWSIWWYGGSLGQRTMVQTYPVLAFPLAALVGWVGMRGRWIAAVFASVCLLFTAYNLWLTHQAHRGGLLVPEWNNRSYFWRTLFTFDVDPDDKLLLDNVEFFRGTPRAVDTLYTNQFEAESPEECDLEAIAGAGSYCLKGLRQSTEEYAVPGPFAGEKWLRATADFRAQGQRWNVYNHAQLVLRFYRDGAKVKERLVRVNRVLNQNPNRSVTIEARAPEGGADRVTVVVWNGGDSQPALLIDNLRVMTLEE